MAATPTDAQRRQRDADQRRRDDERRQRREERMRHPPDLPSRGAGGVLWRALVLVAIVLIALVVILRIRTIVWGKEAKPGLVRIVENNSRIERVSARREWRFTLDMRNPVPAVIQLSNVQEGQRITIRASGLACWHHHLYGRWEDTCTITPRGMEFTPDALMNERGASIFPARNIPVHALGAVTGTKMDWDNNGHWTVRNSTHPVFVGEYAELITHQGGDLIVVLFVNKYVRNFTQDYDHGQWEGVVVLGP